MLAGHCLIFHLDISLAMATAFCNTTTYGTTPDRSLEYQESLDRVVTNFLETRYHAFPAWKRLKSCAQNNLSDLQTHLVRFYEHEYHFKENQILLAVVKRFGWQSEGALILNWLNEQFLLRVQEATHSPWTMSREVALLSEKMTRLAEELQKSTLALEFAYDSSAKHEEPVEHQARTDDDLKKLTHRVQELEREVGDRHEKNLYQLYARTGEHGARIDALENKVFRILSKPSTTSAGMAILGREEIEQGPSGSPDEDSEVSTAGMLTPTSVRCTVKCDEHRS